MHWNDNFYVLFQPFGTAPGNQMTTDYFSSLSSAVVALNNQDVTRLAKEAIDAGENPAELIEKGIAAGMSEVGRLFSCHEYFVPEVLVAARAAQAGIDILKAALKGATVSNSGTVVLGVVKGDIHDLGKNIVRVMLEANGYEVIDLGKNVPITEFVRVSEERAVDMVGLSTLMTTTMPVMKETLYAIKSLRSNLPVMIGGAPVTADFAKTIGADFYGANAHEAVLICRSITRTVIERA